MSTTTCLMLGVSALAIAGCTNLPGSSLGATFGAERYLNGTHGGSDFNGSLASEYTELGRRAAFKDVLWLNSTAYIAKAQQAEAGVTPAPWMASELGVSPPSDTGTAGDMVLVYDELVRVINANKDARPAACARMQAMWDQYLEALRGEEAGSKFCISVEDARAMLREAAIACRPATESGFVVYFGFNETNLTDAARQTLDAVVAAVRVLGTDALSVVGHTDTVASVEYNQTLSEARANRVANALTARGVPAGALTLAGRSENNPAVDTGDE
ncbi:MAG: OmpA family protein, partial [Gammaproteobacteria bacterium]|nr:OmpA family protein [Gammaproteobacteria bacterium]